MKINVLKRSGPVSLVKYLTESGTVMAYEVQAPGATPNKVALFRRPRLLPVMREYLRLTGVSATQQNA